MKKKKFYWNNDLFGDKMNLREKWEKMVELMIERPSPFYDILLKAADTHYRKNSNYATKADPFSNLRMCEQFGIPAWKGVLVRLSDKWSRITNLADGVEDKVGESLKDTVMDLGVYSLILYTLLEEAEKSKEPVMYPVPRGQ